MKKYILVFIYIMCNIMSMAETPENVTKEFRNDINLKFFNKSRVILETGFGNGSIINVNAIEELKGKDILKVNLIYTTYREADDFDQIDLNTVRWKNLFTHYPELKEMDKVKFIQIGTEKCKTKECADDQLHGFIIEYKKELFGYRNLEIQEVRANSKSEISITGKSGTKVHVPANAFVDLHGNEISGTVSLQLREALTAEDIVSANLLTITDKNEALESGGMIQLQAFNNGKQLKLRDGAKADISIPKTKDNTDMQVWNGEWVDGQLKWNEPKELFMKEKKLQNIAQDVALERIVIVDDKFVFEEDEIEKDEIEEERVTLLTWFPAGDKITKLLVSTLDGDIIFDYDDMEEQLANDEIFSDFQKEEIRVWMNSGKVDNVPQKFWGNGWGNNWERGMGKMNIGTNSGWLDDETANTFQMSNLGWANIDRLASFPNSKKSKLEIFCENDSIAEDMSISLILPKRDMYIPGYKMESGNYRFSHGDYEDDYYLPVGDKAFVIITGKKGSKDFAAIKKIKLGENNVEETKLVEKDKKTTLQEIRTFL